MIRDWCRYRPLFSSFFTSQPLYHTLFTFFPLTATLFFTFFFSPLFGGVVFCFLESLEGVELLVLWISVVLWSLVSVAFMGR